MFGPVLAVRASRWAIHTEAIYYCEFNFWKISSWKTNFCSNGSNHKSRKIVIAIGCVEADSWLIWVQPGVHEKSILALLSYALLLPRAIVLRDFWPARFCYCALLSARFCRRGFVLRAFVGSPYNTPGNCWWSLKFKDQKASTPDTPGLP